MIKTSYRINNIDIIMANTNKFKNTCFKIIFSGKYDEKNVSKRNILIDMLIDSTKKYDSNKLFNNKLNDLYSTDVRSDYYKSYELTQTEFTISCVNERYLKEIDFYKQIVELIYEILFNPRVKNNLFNEIVFKESKDNLENKIKSLYDSKTAYSLKKLLENMAPDEVISKTSLGTLEELETIKIEDIYEEYHRLLGENMAIYIAGEFNEKEMINYFNKFYSSPKTQKGKYFCPLSFQTNNKFVIEKQEINQSRLCIGYRINKEFNLKNYIIGIFFNYIFGGSYSSALMTKIRKENSFAYSVDSRTVIQFKIMIINMGIDKKNYKKILKLIEKEIHGFNKGLISEELLESTKNILLSEIKNNSDNLGSIISYVIFKNLYGFSLEDNDTINLINEIGIKDIQEFSKEIVLDTVFLLEGN